MFCSWYLLPGASTWTARPPELIAPRFGTIRLIQGSTDHLLHEPLDIAMHEPGWMPLAIQCSDLRESDRASIAARFRRYPVVVLSGSKTPAPAFVLNLIYQGPAPTPQAARRLLLHGHPRNGYHPGYEFIFEQICALPSRTYRHFVRRRLGCTTNDLYWLWRLAAGPRLCPTVDALAAEHRTTPNHLREWIAHLLGIPAKHYNRCPGWEWVICAARENGLLKPPREDGRPEAGRRRRKHWDEGEQAGQRGSGTAGQRDSGTAGQRGRNYWRRPGAPRLST